jgi:CDP-diacylglycerol--serine O-phosphatidyltransferase
VIALANAIACALRLARFNAQIDADDQPHKKLGYLTGIPAPAAAGLTLAPLYVHFWLAPSALDDLAVRAGVVAVTSLTVAFLMVSNLPSYGWGSLRLRPSWRLPALAAIGLLAGALFTNPWPTLAIITIVYAVSIPMAINSYARVKARTGRTIDDRTNSADDGIQPPP